MAARHAVLVAMVLATSGCSAAFMQGFADGLAAGAAARDGASTPSSALSGTTTTTSGDLLLFGGSGHDTFLGCLSCSEYDSSSVFNRYGTFGSRYASDSIFNPYGQFGSRYSAYSACNPYAADPPVVVDDSGAFYGRLTINPYSTETLSDPRILQWLKVVCEG